MTSYELNIDGLVGPSHHYAGLSLGNIASMTHAGNIANPAKAAHQGIDKMRLLHRLGVQQAFFPPHPRPNLQLLRQVGFTGTPEQQIKKARKLAPKLLSASYSASSMWTANMATVTPSTDTKDKRVHFTVANLISHIHRAQEAHFSQQLLQHFFANKSYFKHHPPLPSSLIMSDEGAANHSRLCHHHEAPGLHLFVYGKTGSHSEAATPAYFPARQTREASEAIARLHTLDPKHLCFAKQNPLAIDAGVFHNDVIAVANESLLLVHEDAFFDQQRVYQDLRHKAGDELHIIEIKRTRLSLADAVRSYLFNSQLITLPSTKEMILIAPTEAQQHPTIAALINEWITDADNPIQHVYYVDLKQSMRNGGGPACLRLRVPLQQHELAAIHPGILINEATLNTLDLWVDQHYRNRLAEDDLNDPSLHYECFSALDDLTSRFSFGSIYPFQQEKTV